MKLLVLSDAHANIWALRQVVEQEQDYDYLAFAGDMVDYGIAPGPVIEWFQNAPRTWIVQGNHDLHALNIARETAGKQVPDKEYKWIHYDLERMTPSQLDYLRQLPKSVFFTLDGWAYVMEHQYKFGTYETIENTAQFTAYWKEHAPQEYWDAPKKRIIFGHSHRQCIHILAEGMEWFNPGSISYRRPDDPLKTAQYMVVENGTIHMKNVPYDRSELYQEAMRQLHQGRMMDTEIQDFRFFFGDAQTSRDPLPEV